MKDQMVAVDQAANIGVNARQDPLSLSGRSARRQMRQAKPAMLTEVDMRAGKAGASLGCCPRGTKCRSRDMTMFDGWRDHEFS
jgi:hypothetical protein